MMHIACAADEGFVPHCAAMLHSLFQFHESRDITVHFLHDDALAGGSLDALRAMTIQAGKAFESHLVPVERRRRFPGNRLYGQVAWYRILLPELLADQEKVLYLDADTIVMRDLAPLWETKLGNHPLAAVANPLYSFMDRGFLHDLGLRSLSEYFNSGVLLMNLTEWRNQGIIDRLLTFAETLGAGQTWPDQNALNTVLKGKWMALPPEWNVQNTLYDLPVGALPFEKQAIRAARRRPGILHFIGPYKPWHYRCKHRYRGLYWQHLAHTRWAGRPLDGVDWRNRCLRLLPEQWGWKLEIILKRHLKTIKSKI